MSAPLHRIELCYNESQDRLILILHSQDFNEYLFWITRRGVKIFWTVLTQLLQTDQKDTLEHARESQHWAEKIQEEKVQTQPIANKLGTRVAKRPFGDEPLLLAKITAKPNGQGQFLMRLDDVGGHWIEFGGNTSIIVALCELILETTKTADWGLNLNPNS